MDTFKFDSVARLVGSGMTRRDALRGLVAGAAAVAAGGTLLTSEEAAARKKAPQPLCRQELVRRPDPHLRSRRGLRQVPGGRLR
jgi:hypothetical protein